jgi:hypothetical protein
MDRRTPLPPTPRNVVFRPVRALGQHSELEPAGGFFGYPSCSATRLTAFQNLGEVSVRSRHNHRAAHNGKACLAKRHAASIRSQSALRGSKSGSSTIDRSVELVSVFCGPERKVSASLSLTLANFGSARGSVVCRVNRYAREFLYGPGLAVTVKKFTDPIFCASNHR